MASTNGVLSPPLHTDSVSSAMNLSSKRKRDDTVEGHKDVNCSNSKSDLDGAVSTQLSPEESKQFVQMLIDVLKVHDTTPSILARAVPGSPSTTSSPLAEPQIKRQKAADNNGTRTSILARSGSYSSVDQVLEDIDAVVSEVLEGLRPSISTTRNPVIPPQSAQTDLITMVTAFKERAHELVDREKAAIRYKFQGSSANALSSHKFAQVGPESDKARMVLTLYGNAPVPKQLFSSLQIPEHVPGDSREVIHQVSQAGLPNGITLTRAFSGHSIGLIDDKKLIPTLGELFPTPQSVPALVTPKPSKIATTRSSTVGWYQPSTVEPFPRTPSYFKQAISSGQWLDYSSSTTVLQSNKRKQRDRALSLVSGTKPTLEAEPAETEAVKLEALFKSAYSSFAPTRDNSAAIVPTGLLDRMWWQHVGEKSFERLVENTSNLDLVTSSQLVQEGTAEQEDDIGRFEEIVEELEKDVIDPSLVTLGGAAEKSVEEKDVEEILEGISDLLETLNSYQRVRHMSLNATSRPAGILSAPDTTSTFTPTKPSEPEQATYEILRSQLTLMIATLPPYAVAKLDPDRLSELSISAKIEVQSINCKGVMEEEESSVSRARMAALNAASSGARVAVASPSSLHRNSSSSQLYGNQYSASRPAVSTAHQYYNQAQTHRTAAPNMQRPPSTAPVPYHSQRPVSTTPFRPYGAYNQQVARPVQQTYTPSAQPAARPAQSSYTPSTQQAPRLAQPSYTPTQQAHHAQTSNGRTHLRPPNQPFQQSAQATPLTALTGHYSSTVAYSHPNPRPASGISHDTPELYQNRGWVAPQPKPMSMYTGAASAHPAPYSSPQSNMPQGSYSQSPTRQGGSSNGVAPQPVQPTYTATTPSSPSGFLSHHNNEQRQSIMQHAQQLAQQQARTTAQAALASPSKTQTTPMPAGL